MSERIYLSPPHMGPEERELLLAAFDSNWVAPAGPDIGLFEAEFARMVGLDHAAALSSGTAALHLALMAVGVQAGDTVLVSDLTFAASANAVTYVGAKPIFIDSETTSWNVDPMLVWEELESLARMNRLPAAMVAVDLYGQAADYAPLVEACQRYEVPLIEDAAEALGAQYRGRPAGSFGDLAIFSFNGNKIITTGGGGMLVGRNAELVDRARHWATQAREPVLHYEHREVGYNYRLSNLLAAIGRGQLLHLQARVDARRLVFERYRVALGGLPGVAFMPCPEWSSPTRWLTVATIDRGEFGLSAHELCEVLAAHDIEARPAWKPMHLQPCFAGVPVRGGRVSEQVFRTGICLPSGSALTDSQQHRIIDVILRAHHDARPDVTMRGARR